MRAAGDWMAVADIQTRRLDLAKSKLGQGRDPRRDGASSPRTSATRSTTRSPPGTRRSTSTARTSARLRRARAAARARRAAGTTSSSCSSGAPSSTPRSATARPRSRRSPAPPTSGKAKLDNPDAAGEILEKILAREPGSVAALTRLSKIYERAGDWDKCKATLEQALRLVAEGPRRRRSVLPARRGRARRRLRRRHRDPALPAGAHATTRRTPRAIAALEKLARERRDNALLADMLQRRVATIDGAGRARRAARRDRGARAQGRPHRCRARRARPAPPHDAPDDVARARAARRPVLRRGPARRGRADLRPARRGGEGARRMKDVARFRQRQGGILEARGDRRRRARRVRGGAARQPDRRHRR